MNDYEKYLDKQAKYATLKERIFLGEDIYFHADSNVSIGQVIKISEKSVKVKFLKCGQEEEVKSFPYFKVAKKEDKVVLVWEAWRGASGRGGYRWEREAYENLRISTEKIPKQTWIAEEAFLKINKYYENEYLKKINTNINKSFLKK